MSDDFETAVLTQLEALSYSVDCVTTVSVSSDVFVNTLDTHFKSRTSVCQHVVKMGLQAVVRSCLNSNSDSLGLALLREHDRLFNSSRRVAR